jgi:alkanesulfonate monooxygenase SsuD/methylene tetrahydromethanopterin reductase-like flavin-dependent oxidoreductase (luciferase family)
MLGVGVGWNEQELANCRPIRWSQRYRALRECVLALKSLWSEDEAAFHGDFFDFDPVWSDPKPLQSPHPPILCGMAGKLGTAHAVEWADGWLPLDAGLGNVEHKLRLFREATAAAGRTEIPVTIVAWGNPTFDVLLRYRDLGVHRVLLGAAREGLDDPASTFEFVDFYANVIDRL